MYKRACKDGGEIQILDAMCGVIVVGVVCCKLVSGNWRVKN
jgi:hypothetical protein